MKGCPCAMYQATGTCYHTSFIPPTYNWERTRRSSTDSEPIAVKRMKERPIPPDEAKFLGENPKRRDTSQA